MQAFYSAHFFQDILITLERIRMQMTIEYGEGFMRDLEQVMVEIQNAKSLVCDHIFCLFLIYVFPFCNL